MHRVIVVDYENGKKIAVEVQFDGETERKRFVAYKCGAWGKPIKVDADHNGYICSNCGEFGVPCWHYCPNCGAKMDSTEDDKE